MSEIRLKARAGEALDELVWRAVGERQGLVEATLEANPGIAELGEILPEGTDVIVPVPLVAIPTVPQIQLWS